MYTLLVVPKILHIVQIQSIPTTLNVCDSHSSIFYVYYVMSDEGR